MVETIKTFKNYLLKNVPVYLDPKILLQIGIRVGFLVYDKTFSKSIRESDSLNK